MRVNQYVFSVFNLVQVIGLAALYCYINNMNDEYVNKVCVLNEKGYN